MYSRLVTIAIVFTIGCSSSNTPAPVPAIAPAKTDHPAPTIRFDDITAAAGIDFRYDNGEEAGHFAIIESLGGGVALLDYDHDGLFDIFFPGGGRYEGKNVTGRVCKLYRNLGKGKFADVSEAVGLTATAAYSHGAAAFDYDNDGWTDLLITGYNRLQLFHNESDGKGGRRFVDVTMRAGLGDKLWSSSAGWADLNGDGYADLYIAHYGDWGFDTNHPIDCTYDGKTRDVCQPRRFKPLTHMVYRNNRDGTFTDVSASLKLRTDGRGMGVLIADFDGDRKPDIYVANDTDDNFLYRNRSEKGEIALEELGLIANVARDDRGQANGSMGLDAGDFNRTGLPSLIVGNYESELPALYRNRCEPGTSRFSYATLSAGIAIVGSTYVNWGSGFQDFDHDGWEELLICNGHAIRFPTKIDRRQKPLLFWNEKGRYVPIGEQVGGYLAQPHNARGAAFGDLDNDGKIDVVINHLNEPVTVLKNVTATPDRHWLGLHLHGKNNRDIVGSKVVIECQGEKLTRFVKGGGSFASTNDPRLHFGLGNQSKIDKVTVTWSWGETQDVTGIQSDGYWSVKEGVPAAEPLK